MNRALAAKAERAARQRREAIRLEMTKPAYLRPKEAAPRVEDHKVTLCTPAPYERTSGRPEGKGHRSMVKRCYGNWQGPKASLLTPDVFVAGSWLIPRTP